MAPGRPRTAIGTFGDFTYVSAPDGKVRARVRFRDDDGQLRLVQATGDSRRSAERALKEKLTQRDRYASGYGELSAESSFGKLVQVWLDDLDLENALAPSTRALYERNMRQLVMPAFEHHALREISVRKVDQFIKTLAKTNSYSMAKQPAPFSASPSGWPCATTRCARTRSATPLDSASHPPRRCH